MTAGQHHHRRERLPNRRSAETHEFVYDGATYQSLEELAAAYIESRGDRLVDDVPPDLNEGLAQLGAELAIAEAIGQAREKSELEPIEGEDRNPS